MNEGKMNQENRKDEQAAGAETQAEQSTSNGGGPASADESTGSQTSEKKKQANRENAKHSTGPKTDRGKFWSRYNALTYGFYTPDVVIRSGDGKEDAEQFEIYLDGLRRSWKPQDLMQESLVRTIAECDWRLRRAARAEVGEIRRTTDAYFARQDLDSFEDIEDSTRPFWTRKESKRGARDSAVRIKNRIAVLEQARTELDKSGYVPEELVNALASEFGHKVADRAHRLSQLTVLRLADEGKRSSPGQEQGERRAVGAEELDEEKRVLSRVIEIKISALQDFLTNLEAAGVHEVQAGLLASNLPPREFVDKVIRYETAVENKKHKAIAWLLKLQSPKR